MVKVKVKKKKPSLYAYIEYKCAYGKVPFDNAYNKLGEWAKKSGAKKAFAPPFAIYMTDPCKVPEDKNITRVAITIKKKKEGANEIKVAEFPGWDVAETWHKAPVDEYTKTYKMLADWVTDNGYETIAPPIEVYMGMPKEKDGKMMIKSVIQFPVKKR